MTNLQAYEDSITTQDIREVLVEQDVRINVAFNELLLLAELLERNSND